MKYLALVLAVLSAPAMAHNGPEPMPVAVKGPAHASAFSEGLYLLHNFEYERAAKAFRRAQAEDPGNVMAYWGEAMTFNHPLWAFQDTERARAVLERLGASPETRRDKARTARDRAWLGAVEALYGEGDKLARDRAYHDKMAALFDSNPKDIDARAFLGLAILGLANEGRDVPTYMRAAAILEEGYTSHPDHPGILHYLIHSYDDPVHAPLGLRAARRYAVVAPDAGHAQHMVSHIYLAMGNWPAVEATNVQAVKVVDAERATAGRSHAACGHYNEWLIYALDQQGKDSKARVEACRKQAVAQLAAASDKSVLGQDRSSFNSWAMIAALHAADTGNWPDEGLVPAGDGNLLGRFNLAYAGLLAARNDPTSAATRLEQLKGYRTRILAALPMEAPDDHESAPWFDLAVLQGEGLVALASGQQAQGMDLLVKASRAEAALPQPFGPPILAKPSFELLGDELLRAGRKAEAAKAFREALARTPNRRRSLEGLRLAQ